MASSTIYDPRHQLGVFVTGNLTSQSPIAMLPLI